MDQIYSYTNFFIYTTSKTKYQALPKFQIWYIFEPLGNTAYHM